MNKKKCLTNIPNFILNSDYNNNSLSICGDNSGNCLFWESVKKLLQKKYEIIESIQSATYKSYDKIVIVLANSVCNHQRNINHSLYLTNTLKKYPDCKKYLISIGAQNKDYTMFNLENKDMFQNFFSVFDKVYLRGEYTWHLLNHNGISNSNIKTVGCPSICFKEINFDKILNKFINLPNKIKLGIHVPTYNQLPDNILLSKFENIIDSSVFTLIQTDLNAVNFCKGLNPEYKMCNKTFTNNSNFFFSIDAKKQIDYISQLDIVIGTRIHGTIYALLANVPCVCIAIDSRTLELCRMLKIPYINCIYNNELSYDKISFNNKEQLIKIFKQNFNLDVPGIKKQIDYQLDMYSKIIND